MFKVLGIRNIKLIKMQFKYIKNNVPWCFIEPNDISQAVIFLENSKHITGTNIIIDGGQTRKII